VSLGITTTPPLGKQTNKYSSLFHLYSFIQLIYYSLFQIQFNILVSFTSEVLSNFKVCSWTTISFCLFGPKFKLRPTKALILIFQVPFCGSTQTSPSLDDKANNPYFMRTQSGVTIGFAVLTLLEKWNVTKYSIVVGSDDISSACMYNYTSEIFTNCFFVYLLFF
jgi:hypothetical protein